MRPKAEEVRLTKETLLAELDDIIDELHAICDEWLSVRPDDPKDAPPGFVREPRGLQDPGQRSWYLEQIALVLRGMGPPATDQWVIAPEDPKAKFWSGGPI